MNIPPGVPLLIGHCRVSIFGRRIKSHAAIFQGGSMLAPEGRQLACTIQRGNGENIAFYSSQYVTKAGAQAAERRGANAPRRRCQRQLSVATGQKSLTSAALASAAVCLRVAFNMRAQLCNRAELHRSVRQLGLDRSVSVKRVGHAIAHAGFENCVALRLFERRGLWPVIFGSCDMLRL